MEANPQLKQASEALRIGDRAEAKRILDELIVKEPENSEVWQMLFSVMENPLEKHDCLKNIVRIHPEDQQAFHKLHKYEAGAEYRLAKASIQAANIIQEDKKTKPRKLREGIDKALSLVKQLIGW